MPEEVLVIVVLSIVFGSIISIVKTVLSYRERTRFGTQQRQVTQTSSAEGTSLTTSELRDMMREAVTEATAPLADRMDALERKVQADGRTESPRADLLQDSMDPAEPTPVRKTIGGRAQ